MRLIPRRKVLAGFTGLAAGAHVARARPSIETAPSVLIVGVSTYDYLAPLPSAIRDAALMDGMFRSLGYQTTMLANPSKEEFLYGLAKFITTSKQSSLMLAYVAAHGAMLAGQNHIFFRDGRTIEDRVPETILLQAMNDQPRQKILFLDTCREAPISYAREYSDIKQYKAGTHVSYAAQPGAPAIDGQSGYSPYARALQDALKTPGLDISEINRKVRLRVLRETNGLQIPWERSSLLQPVILNL